MPHPCLPGSPRIHALAALLIAPAIAAAAGGADAGAHAPALRADGAYAVIAGSDTAMIERWTRTGDSLRVSLDLIGQARLEFEAGLTPDAAVSGMTMRVYQPGGTEPAEEARARFVGDSVIAVQRMQAGMDTVRRGTRAGAVPYLSPSVTLTEQIVRRARAMGGDSALVPVFVVGSGGQTLDASVRIAGDSAVVRLGASEMRLGLATDGSLTGGVIPQQATVRVVRLR